MIDRRDLMRGMAVVAASTFLPHEEQRELIAPGSWAAIRTEDRLFAVGDRLPMPMACEVSGLVMMIAKVKSCKPHGDGWWYELELVGDRQERIQPADWNAVIAERRAALAA